MSNLAQQSITELPTGDIDHVIDGGSLLHCIPRPTGSSTYHDICKVYREIIARLMLFLMDMQSQLQSSSHINDDSMVKWG